MKWQGPCAVLTEVTANPCWQGITGMRADMTGARKDPAFMSISQHQQPAAAAADASGNAAVTSQAQQRTGAEQMDLDGRCASALTTTKVACRIAAPCFQKLMA
jgi:hypothetical protein